MLKPHGHGKTARLQLRLPRAAILQRHKLGGAGRGSGGGLDITDGGGGARLGSVTYGNGKFVAVANNGTHRVMTSPDGVTWTAQTATEASSWNSVTYANGLFVAVNSNGTHRVMTSPDGITWTAQTAAEANGWNSVTYGTGVFVAVASSGTHRVMTSPDGVTWTAQTAAEANAWLSVTDATDVRRGDEQRHAPGDDLAGRRHVDGADSIGAKDWRFIAYGNGIFVVVAIRALARRV